MELNAEINTKNPRADMTVEVGIGSEFQSKHRRSLDTPYEADGRMDLTPMTPGLGVELSTHVEEHHIASNDPKIEAPVEGQKYGGNSDLVYEEQYNPEIFKSDLNCTVASTMTVAILPLELEVGGGRSMGKAATLGCGTVVWLILVFVFLACFISSVALGIYCLYVEPLNEFAGYMLLGAGGGVSILLLVGGCFFWCKAREMKNRHEHGGLEIEINK
jgi:hypothetical protein